MKRVSPAPAVRQPTSVKQRETAAPEASREEAKRRICDGSAASGCGAGFEEAESRGGRGGGKWSLGQPINGDLTFLEVRQGPEAGVGGAGPAD
jgi:hypothetical protein